MNRRAVFQNFLQLGSRGISPPRTLAIVTTDMTEHTDPLTLADVYHLLRRMGFGPTLAQAQSMVGKTPAQVVDELLGASDEADPPSPGSWIDGWTEDPEGADLQTRNAIYATWRNNMAALANWWIALMTTDAKAIEKTTLFWSGHWTTEFSFDNTNSVPQALYRQYLTLRRDRLGDLRSVALDITLDSAMLNYLGGTYNTNGKPNENYARELMELYLTGIGWYTEGDVKEAARVLTGWRTQKYSDSPAPNGKYEAWFDAVAHDTGAKQVLGQTIPARTADNNTAYQVKTEEVLRLIEIICDVRKEAVSRFIAEKVYRYFVYSSPGEIDPLIIEPLAQTFRDADFETGALFKALFTSKHFFSAEMRGAQIKTPIEYVAGLQRQLGIADSNPQAWVTAMDQPVMDPPTVAGWPGYRTWISTNTYPQRRDFAKKLIEKMSDTQANALISSFEDYTDANKLVANVVSYLLPVEVSAERQQFYLDALMQGAPAYDWPSILNTPSAAAARFRNLLITISRAPDFQLC